MRIDLENGRASAEASVAADHPLFADHFPRSPLLPGSLMIELAAQVSGPLAEEIAKTRIGNERWAILGMVRDARFLSPVFLPATISINARAIPPAVHTRRFGWDAATAATPAASNPQPQTQSAATADGERVLNKPRGSVDRSK